MPPISVQVNIANVVSVHGQYAGFRQIEPDDQIKKCGLSRAGFADKCYRFAGVYFQIHAAKQRLIVLIREIHVLEFVIAL